MKGTRSNTILVSLAGGLGNQMFQLAAGLAQPGSLQLDRSIAYPKLNNLNEPEIQSFILPSGIVILPEKKPPRIMNKTVNLFLRMSASKRDFTKIRGYRILNCIGTIVTSVYLRKPTRLIASSDLGDSDVMIGSGRSLLVGLFQSVRWVEIPEVSRIMKEMKVARPSKELQNLASASLIEKPLVVHVRLGDYLAEADFGIPTANYYEKAIALALEEGGCNWIWLFSNDIDGALQLMPKNIDIPIRTIGDLGNSSAESLEAMRYGYGYVIANSTFSWWGAYLSYCENPPVFFPEPWFKSTHAPKNLTPSTWKGIFAWS